MEPLAKLGEPSSRPTQPPKEGSIPLYLMNGVATVWDAQTAATLHCVHSVSGLRIGTLPGVAQQNGFLGLPVTLMQEETAYLVQEGIAHLIPLNTNPSPPSTALIESHTAARVARIRAFEERAREEEVKRQAESRAKFDQAGEKARAKREARAKAKEERERKAREEAGEEEPVKAGEPSTPAVPEVAGSTPKSKAKASTTSPASDSKPKPSPPSAGYFHAVPSHPVILSLTPSSSNVTPITSLPHPLFPFPTTTRDHALLAVYSTLQARSYRMGLGPRFGGEYLVYPGDYLRYHAHFTSQVIVRDEPIWPAEIVAWGRLGTGTKKAGLLCCWDDGQREEVDGEREKAEEVEFYSLEWANFG
ncbi:hypothetical protein IAT38_001148 [Cryptococcus sp. DSM 104549]